MKLQSVFVAIALIVAGMLLGAMITSPATAQPDALSPKEPVTESQGREPAVVPQREQSEERRPAYYYYDSLRTPASDDGSFFEDEQMPGRFQMALERMNNSNRIVVVVCDTSSGQCWSGQVGSSNWKNMGVPSFVKNKDFMPPQPRSKGDGFMDLYEEQPSQPKTPYVPIGPSLDNPPQR